MSAFYALRHAITADAHVGTEDQDASRHSHHTIHAWPATFLAAQPSASASDDKLSTTTDGLSIDGRVSTPAQWSLADLMQMPRVNQIRRIVSADGWSYKGHWQGVDLRYLLDIVQPLPDAHFLKQYNAHGLVEYLPLADLLKGDYLLAHHEGDTPLSPLYGGPLWLLVFDRYTYKGLSQLRRLTLCQAPDEPATSKTRGYSENGLWENGSRTYVIDLKAYKTLDRSGHEIKSF